MPFPSFGGYWVLVSRRSGYRVVFAFVKILNGYLRVLKSLCPGEYERSFKNENRITSFWVGGQKVM